MEEAYTASVEQRVELAKQLTRVFEETGMSLVPRFGKFTEQQFSARAGNYMVRVNSTIEAGVVRGKGRDSIKVFLTMQEGDVIVKGSGVKTRHRRHRVGTINGICERIRLEILEAMAIAVHFTENPP